ncbi:hypothetical protein O9G_000339 [Rozella allomycis CSF55]|uniref:Uncharacterized protein n=1 Tax=Rozella allomycis (strain CSF55) TaxID=988480 RepID=A0A075AYD3_ROZAC|nr:hypothetical protein O9G_000339 [Rozella allomycis CSF55]|eukprot:EPZ33564.1 hypothetical protein O9G_000339 [Rozella allomycis CSF55]
MRYGLEQLADSDDPFQLNEIVVEMDSPDREHHFDEKEQGHNRSRSSSPIRGKQWTSQKFNFEEEDHI